jgi:hypothetical protein
VTTDPIRVVAVWVLAVACLVVLLSDDSPLDPVWQALKRIIRLEPLRTAIRRWRHRPDGPAPGEAPAPSTGHLPHVVPEVHAPGGVAPKQEHNR